MYEKHLSEEKNSLVFVSDIYCSQNSLFLQNVFFFIHVCKMSDFCDWLKSMVSLLKKCKKLKKTKLQSKLKWNLLSLMKAVKYF